MTTYRYDYLTARNKEKTIKETKNNFKADKNLSVMSFDNAVIASKVAGGPGVFSSYGYVEESDIHVGGSPINGLSGEINIPKNNEEVVYIGSLICIWGHCLTDNLKHLWFLQDERYKHLTKLKFAYTMCNENDSFSGSLKALFNKLGVFEDQMIRISGAERFSKVYLPEQCFFCVPGGALYRSGYRYYTKEYQQIIQKIIECTEKRPGPEKIYLTRTKCITQAKNRYRDFGESSIEDFFRKLGYDIISPEELTLDEQISVVHSCKYFASTQGSISLNALFCKEGTEVCIINKQNYNAPYQLAVNQLISCNITIIDANQSTLNDKSKPWEGPFFLYQSKELCAWGNQQYRGFPFKDYAMYLAVGEAKEAMRKFRKMKGRIKCDLL